MLVCSPEYAHGVPGSLKNALDWVVGSGEFVGKPVALLNAAPRATHAHAALREILSTMDARVVPGEAIPVPLSGRRLEPGAIAEDPALAGAIRRALDALIAAASAGDPGE